MLILDKIRKIETKEISAKIARWSEDQAAATAVDDVAVAEAARAAASWAVSWSAEAARAAASWARSASWARPTAEATAEAAFLVTAEAAFLASAEAAYAAARASSAAKAVADADFYVRLASKLKELSGDDFSYHCFCGSKAIFEQLNDKIKIGCISKPKAWWLENYKEIGKKHGYTEGEIEEYGNYIKYI